MKALSLFAGGGIGETYFEEIGVHTVIANELLPDRAAIHKYRFPNTEMVVGDIKENKSVLIQKAKENNVDLIVATPPCQGMSTAGKRDYVGDERNYLIFDVLDIVDAVKPNYILIENVPKFLKMSYPFNGTITPIMGILNKKYSEEYEIIGDVYNAKDYNVPQSRKRTIIRMFKKGLTWGTPEKSPEITLREAIGHLPSLANGEDSGIKWHYCRKLPQRMIDAMSHTPTGHSAYENDYWYPKQKDGSLSHAFANAWKRMDWDEPCPTRTMNSNSVTSSNNCHPGRLLPDGTYSDARCLSLLELFIVSSLPTDIDLPENITEKQIRDIVGEGVPPKMLEAFVKMIS